MGWLTLTQGEHSEKLKKRKSKPGKRHEQGIEECNVSLPSESCKDQCDQNQGAGWEGGGGKAGWLENTSSGFVDNKLTRI